MVDFRSSNGCIGSLAEREEEMNDDDRPKETRQDTHDQWFLGTRRVTRRCHICVTNGKELVREV